MPKNKNKVAERLAQAHYACDSGITQIFRVGKSADADSAESEPIKLLEINNNTIPTGIMPLAFDPHPASGIPYPSIIIEVTPEEYETLIPAGLPNSWKILEQISRKQ